MGHCRITICSGRVHVHTRRWQRRERQERIFAVVRHYWSADESDDNDLLMAAADSVVPLLLFAAAWACASWERPCLGRWVGVRVG